MFNLLEKLRTKSRAQRTFVAFSISLLCTGVVFVVWLVAERRSETGETPKVVTENTPTDTLFKNISDMWGGVVSGVKSAQDGVKNLDFSSTVEYQSATSTASGDKVVAP
jgi:hypothetical protein